MTFQAILTVAEITGNFKPDGLFEVFSIAGGKSLSTPMGWDATWDEFERITVGSGGACNGMDVRKIKDID